jgi:hypothetical protein
LRKNRFVKTKTEFRLEAKEKERRLLILYIKKTNDRVLKMRIKAFMADSAIEFIMRYYTTVEGMAGEGVAKERTVGLLDETLDELKSEFIEYARKQGVFKDEVFK